MLEKHAFSSIMIEKVDGALATNTQLRNAAWSEKTSTHNTIVKESSTTQWSQKSNRTAARAIRTIKTYDIYRTSWFSSREHEIRHAKTPIIWTEYRSRWRRCPLLYLYVHTRCPWGPIAAGARFNGGRSGIEVIKGDPSDTSPTQCMKLSHKSSWSHSSYSFTALATGQTYRWERTRSKCKSLRLLPHCAHRF